MPDVFHHPTALVESADIGPGTRVWAFAHILKNARIGRDCNIGDHCFVESGAIVGDRVTLKNGVCVWDHVTIGNDVFVGPNAVLTNDLWPRSRQPDWTPVPTFIGDGATIGANATVVCGIRVGEYAMIAAGTVVTADVPAHALILGVPGRRRGWVCVCGRKLDFQNADRAVCRHCARSYQHTSPDAIALAAA